MADRSAPSSCAGWEAGNSARARRVPCRSSWAIRVKSQYKMIRGMDPWLVIVAQLPTEDPSARMRVLRKLESLGAGVLREGVYALPDTPANRKSLDELAAHVGREGGTAYALRVAATSQGQNDAFRRLFDRSAQYEALVKIVEGLRLGFGQSDPSALARVLLKQRRDFEAISALDFFPSPAKARAQQALADADQEIRKLYFSKAPTSIATGEKLHGRTWATRKPLRADRLAGARAGRRPAPSASASRARISPPATRSSPTRKSCASCSSAPTRRSPGSAPSSTIWKRAARRCRRPPGCRRSWRARCAVRRATTSSSPKRKRPSTFSTKRTSSRRRASVAPPRVASACCRPTAVRAAP